MTARHGRSASRGEARDDARADVLLVERGLFDEPRARRRPPSMPASYARTGSPSRKASDRVAVGAVDLAAEAPHPWVSRGGVKLAAALDAFGHRSRRPGLPRHRGLDRRLHRRAARAAARQGFTPSMSARSSCTRGSRRPAGSSGSKATDARSLTPRHRPGRRSIFSWPT